MVTAEICRNDKPGDPEYDERLAALVVEQIKPLISQYGGIQAVPAQNMVIITESAAQVRRLSEIIRAIDSEKPMDSATELFRLKYSDPETVVNALKALIGERNLAHVSRFFILGIVYFSPTLLGRL
ncbi:MAG: hypothetical protein IID33_07660, partial [Planctomycetes bacterium]|nr:hypothetical protein [Planctomycetota bacterium]